ncbi:MAG: ParB/RepB/Spo0J family partition protein [Chitinophagales bacterium]
MAKRKKSDLGLGLRSLLGDINTNALKEKKVAVNSIADINISSIEVNPYQPRTEFASDKLEQLSNSIKIHGIVQPITVRKLNARKYQLIAGERRLRAAKMAGLTKVPAYIRTANDQAMLEIALIENIQREDLNPMEVGRTYQRLLEECELTHDDLGERLGKARTTVTNYLRLLKLPPKIQRALEQKSISMGHARALINLSQVEVQLDVFNQILAEHLSVRQVERIAKNLKPKSKAKQKEKHQLSVHFQKVQDNLATQLGTKVNVKQNAKGKGQIIIAFTSDEDLNRILDILQ